MTSTKEIFVLTCKNGFGSMHKDLLSRIGMDKSKKHRTDVNIK